MLYAFLKNPWVMMVICSAIVFAEMFVVKKWFTGFTGKIKKEKVRRSLNVFFGVITCIALGYAQMYAIKDALKLTFTTHYALASGALASFIYLALEKIFTESEVNALGKAFCDFVSHSDLFDGELSTDGVVAVARKLLNITYEIDKEEATKEEEAVNKVVTKLNEFLNDGRITKEEKAEADKLIKESGVALENNSTYEKYKALLGK